MGTNVGRRPEIVRALGPRRQIRRRRHHEITAIGERTRSGDVGDSLAKLVEANASLALTVERLSRQLEEQSKHLHEWRARAEAEAHEKVKWRARYHVARGRIEMDDD